MKPKVIKRIEKLISENPTEAFEIENTNFVMVSAEYYDYLVRCEKIVAKLEEGVLDEL